MKKNILFVSIAFLTLIRGAHAGDCNITVTASSNPSVAATATTFGPTSSIYFSTAGDMRLYWEQVSGSLSVTSSPSLANISGLKDTLQQMMTGNNSIFSGANLLNKVNASMGAYAMDVGSTTPTNATISGGELLFAGKRSNNVVTFYGGPTQGIVVRYGLLSPTPPIGKYKNVPPVFCDGLSIGDSTKISYTLALSGNSYLATDANPSVREGQAQLSYNANRSFSYTRPVELTLTSLQNQIDFQDVMTGKEGIKPLEFTVLSNIPSQIELTYTFQNTPAGVQAKVLNNQHAEVIKEYINSVADSSQTITRMVSVRTDSLTGDYNWNLNIQAQIP
ncbi:hypothetical protein [Citrobacter cronae]|uniref:hypothetical protein n=1 Tax=Citrobacter cronae TaxID=1748967 RepID=UPI0021CEFC1A|nr:hypothetical protein [Citrobacter cronae]MCU6173001.1 hypothetical protein [Citrobacter cronae]